MTRPQPGILAEVPTVARFVTLGLVPDADARAALARLSELRVSGDQVIGVGAPLVLAAGHASVLGLRGFPALVGPGCNVPSTQGAAWLFFRGEDPGEVLHSTRATLASLGGAFRVEFFGLPAIAPLLEDRVTFPAEIAHLDLQLRLRRDELRMQVAVEARALHVRAAGERDDIIRLQFKGLRLADQGQGEDRKQDSGK